MSKPFQGLTFCATGVTEEILVVLNKKVARLGGKFSRDLTGHVQVLVVGSRQSAKYRYVVANRADIVFMDAESIEGIYEKWLAGEDVLAGGGSGGRLLSVLRERFQLAPFTEFYMFIGRISAPEVSTGELQQLCEIGHSYRCLTNHFIKDIECSAQSVFITDCATGARAKAAREEGVPIVHPKWVMDCTKRGAVLEMEYYLLEHCAGKPWHEIGREACSCWDELERGATGDGGSAAAAATGASTAVAAAEQQQDDVRVLKLSGRFKQNGSKIWASTVGRAKPGSGGGCCDPTDKLFRGSPKQQRELDAVSEQHESGLFDGCSFCLLGFSDKQRDILDHVIALHMGTTFVYGTNGVEVNNLSKLTKYYLCPSDFPVERLPHKIQWLTEFYIERCLHYKELLRVDPWCVPFYTRFYLLPPSSLLHGHTTMAVHMTGFQGVELLHMNKILSYLEPMGICYMDTLKSSTDILIINLAQLNSIPAEHTLRQNHYACMFRQQKEQNQVFRNAMKRKIAFINKNSIPLITPGFLIELFRRAAKAKQSGSPAAKIYLNDTNWCIVCPRGSKDDYTIQLDVSIPEPTASRTKSNLMSETLDALKPTGSRTSMTPKGSLDTEAVDILLRNGSAPTVKKSTREFMLKTKALSRSASSLGHPKSSNKQPKVSPKMDEQLNPAPEPPLAIKENHRRSHTEVPLERSNSWGSMLTEEAKEKSGPSVIVNDDTEDENGVVNEDGHNTDNVMHTQVTYGSIANRKDSLPPPSRRLTRRSYKDLS
ncbi:protein kinase activating protein DPB11 Ecym_6341 [Eremothecium cymbalariae DBVPG|uniref:BRCT domain-containing protein n=1 Tax=Eremothecium cymbalariae (strain CBS 270.75 / DBVPG 7215 / KCTC 17166 / NRRL Y-17582) TaxID=931890 RepID=G8JUD7_ERECY|nr:hypothetical protein Ecym_6341 [Eremothecium cymbalariae DBVPG\